MVRVVAPRRRPNLSQRMIGGEWVVLDRNGEKVHQLNATASFVWGRCDGQASESDIARQLADEYDVQPGQAASDVAALVERFRELGLVEPLGE